MRGRPSPLNPHVQTVLEWLQQGFTIAEIVSLFATQLGTPTTDSSVRGLIDRNPELQEARAAQTAAKAGQKYAAAPGITLVNEDIIVITGEPGKRVDELEITDILRRRHLEPSEWQIAGVKDNQWEMYAGRDPNTHLPTKVTLFQLTIQLKRKVPIEAIFPAVVGPKLPKPKPQSAGQPQLTVIVTDHQSPFRLEPLHELFLRWLAENNPHRGIIGGDLLDNGHISRYRDNPAWHRTVQECLQAGFDTLYDYRQASLNTEWALIKGNHDDRIRNEQLERSERLYGVTAAQWPGAEPEEWVYSLNHLLHLKDLGIDYVEPQDSYDFQQVPITNLIAARHGHIVSKEASQKTSDQLGHSIVLGHTHRQSVSRHTHWYSITKDWRVTSAVEAGCMCEIVGGLGYVGGGCPNWQPGFATVTSWPDGGFTFDLATYEQAGVLRWRDQKYVTDQAARLV